MRAEICDVAGAAGLARFQRVLRTFGAELMGDFGSILDVQMLEVPIGQDVLLVVADSWSGVEIDGPAPLVRHIVAAMTESNP